MSGDCGLPKKAVVLRTGGLGDFVLTVPLLVCLIESGCHVTVATRRSYFEIIGDILENITFLDADEMMGSQTSNGLSEILEDATVYSFWKDCDGFLETKFQALGAQRVVELESRPFAPPHVVERIFQDVGMEWKKEFYKRSWLRQQKRSGDCLWVHPGSGSPTKNVPLAWFLDRIERWLAEEAGESVLVSFGEADEEIKEKFRLIGGHLPLKFIHPNTYLELRDELTSQANLFIGNDSGPTHLAAALGIPTEVGFISTDPAVWRPLGEQVKVLRSDELG